MTTTGTNQGTNTNGGTNGGATAKTTKTLTAVDAIGKVSKILDQLSEGDRKRVLAFINASNE